LASAPSPGPYLDIDEREAGSRLDRALLRLLGDGSRPLLMRLIRKGNVRVNGRRARPESRLAAGDRVFLPASLRPGAAAAPAEGVPAGVLRRAEGVPVLYEDDWLLAVDKPAGMVVHGGSGHDAGLVEAMKQLRDLPDLRLAHRLDRDTSGVLLLAKHLESLRRLTASFRERDMHKTYLALVAGHPYPHAGRMRSHLAKGVVRGGERMVVDAEDGKEAVTDFQVMLERRHGDFDWGMVALHPHSGRTHQLRVQLQAEGHAILGDAKYGDKGDLAAFRAMGGKGLMLHAWRLRFAHPVTDASMEIRASLPSAWREILNEPASGREP
jgi:23S rRNA pseudouridine955/2504/2580 synthase